MTKVILVFLVSGLAITMVTSKNLPNYIKVCKRSSPDLSECIMNATVAVQSRIAAGIPELNLPSVEPLTISNLQLEEGTPSVNFKATFQNLKLFGLSNYIFTDLQASDHLIAGKVDLPMLFLESDYELNGRALIVPIRGQGIFTANFTNMKADILFHTGLEVHKGKEYFKSEKTQIKLTIGDVKVHFGNLFNGDPLISVATNMFLNENSKDIVMEVLPAVEAVVEQFVDNFAHKVFRSLPYNKLFLV